MDNNSNTLLDLFCGCGGLSLGFEDAGFDCLLGIDIWEDALKTYRYNRNGVKTLCGDLSVMKGEDIEAVIGTNVVGVVVGGPPCQGFSVAGKRIVDDERNKLYKGFVRMVEYFHPQAFVMENVPNILSIGGGAVGAAIIRDFEALGYCVNVKVLIASDFGVPQNRRRAVFVGLRNGVLFDFPNSLLADKVTSWEALSDLPEGTLSEGAAYPTAPLSDYQRFIRNGSGGVYNHNVTVHNERTKKIISMVPDGGNYKDLPLDLQNTRKVHIAWTRLNSRKPSFTIDCGHNHHFHYKWNRVPTVREAARIQSFPDTFIFTGNKGSQLKQVGNAVPPLMAKAIAEQIKKYL